MVNGVYGQNGVYVTYRAGEEISLARVTVTHQCQHSGEESARVMQWKNDRAINTLVNVRLIFFIHRYFF